MKTAIAAALALTAILSSFDSASAQVQARWRYDGSAVCPEGHDFARGACWPRGGFRGSYARGGSHAVRPHWTRSGSAVCPEGFDYYGGVCRSRY